MRNEAAYASLCAYARDDEHWSSARPCDHSRQSINEFRPEDDPFFLLGGGDTLGLPNPFIIFVLLSILAWIVLNLHGVRPPIVRCGRQQKAARLSGLEVDRLKISVYVISALTAGIAGIVEVSFLSSAIANQGLGKELAVIAAAVIGGTALTGGEGTVSASSSVLSSLKFCATASCSSGRTRIGRGSSWARLSSWPCSSISCERVCGDVSRSPKPLDPTNEINGGNCNALDIARHDCCPCARKCHCGNALRRESSREDEGIRNGPEARWHSVLL